MTALTPAGRRAALSVQSGRRLGWTLVGLTVGLMISGGCSEGVSVVSTARLVGAYIVLEQERMGTVTHALLADVTETVLTDPASVVGLRPGVDREDHHVRERLVLILPAQPINGLEGSFVLWVGAEGEAPAAVRGVTPIQTDGPVVLQLDARSEVEVRGRWAYSRRPGIREVTLTGVDDPDSRIEAEVFHAADLQSTNENPSVVPLDSGWKRLRFELTAPLIEMSTALDGCERVLEVLDHRVGGRHLQWPEGVISEAELESASADVEERAPTTARRFNITFEMGGREITRGKRLQPLVRYPITLLRSDGSAVGAMISCSISDS